MRRLIILGCGSSAGVPRVGEGWGACDPANPKNRRRRCCVLIEQHSRDGVTRVLIDTGPDLKDQLVDAGVTWLDGVVYTHPHADHLHGIDDLRPITISHRKRLDTYLDEKTAIRAHEAFGYCFKTPEGSSYPPILNEHRIVAGEAFSIRGAGGSVDLLGFDVQHGEITALGFRIGELVYLPDVKVASEDAITLSRGARWLIVDALRYRPHVSHFNVEEALAFIDAVKPQNSILTNLHIDLDYETLSRELPVGIVPAHDGLVIEGF